MAHLERLGITRLRVHPDPLKIATEGALWGSVVAHGLLKDAASSATTPASSTRLSRAVLEHAERLKPQAGRLQPPPAAGVCADPGAGVVVLRRPEGILPRSHSAQKAGAWPALTGSPLAPAATLDRLLARLHANKIELLERALERPDIPLRTPTARRMTSAQAGDKAQAISGRTRSMSVTAATAATA